ncbi:MAG: multicopper oxidase domain-containing protein [Bacteroidia bacterium]|nr:multicopper oxidase domain-containing protein [Bacteroidia bacterium]
MKFAKSSFLLLSLTLAFAGLRAQFLNPLFIPDTLTGPVFNLTLAPSYVNFLAGDSTVTHGINQPYLGPTLIFQRGDTVQMHVTNNLTDTTTMHWHGMHVAPEDDGGPHTFIPPNTTWSPSFVIDDEATTHWYHPHLHGHTAEQVYKGAAGMIIVRDAHEASLNLPRTYGVDDFPIIIQDKSFDATNQLIFAAMADTIAINGTLGAFLSVPAQMVRFRLLNGSNQRVYNVGFPTNLPVFQIASDGGLLEAPVPVNTVLLAPGERAQVVVNFGGQNGNNYPFPSLNSTMPPGISGGPGGPGGLPGNPLDSADFILMEFRVNPQTPNPVTSLPTSLNTYVKPSLSNVDRTRIKIMDADPNGFPYYINSTPFNHMVINDTVIKDNIEVWTLINTTDVAHPFHIHDIQFYITELNGSPPPAPMAGRKDVVLVQPGDTISFIGEFTDFVDSVIPYMYHCHNLFHEDAGMMGQFIVVEASWVGREKEIARANGYKLYPNPARDRVRLEVNADHGGTIHQLEVLDIQGKALMRQQYQSAREASLDVSGLTPGMYLLRVQDESGQTATLRMLKR